MKIGRNEPCPCGSGKKFKKCCGALGAYTRDERAEALMRLDHWIETFAGNERDEAHEEFWGAHKEYIDSLPEDLEGLSDAAEDGWFAFDRGSETGETSVDRFMADAELSEGERTFLSACRRSSVRFYTVVGVVPGVSLTVRDAIEGGEITVHERMGSRSIGLYEHVAARVVPRGPSGGPEIESGILHIPALYKDSVISQLRAHRATFLDEHRGASIDAFYKAMGPFFHEVWAGSFLDAAVPEVRTKDGELVVPTTVRFNLVDAVAFERALGARADLEREGDTWIAEDVGRIERRNDHVIVETQTVERAQRARALLEEWAGDAIRHIATVHENLQRAVKDRIRARFLGGGSDESDDEPPVLPPEVTEPLVLGHYGAHYRRWIDEPVPALDGATPREGAHDPSLSYVGREGDHLRRWLAQGMAGCQFAVEATKELLKDSDDARYYRARTGAFTSASAFACSPRMAGPSRAPAAPQLSGRQRRAEFSSRTPDSDDFDPLHEWTDTVVNELFGFREKQTADLSSSDTNSQLGILLEQTDHTSKLVTKHRRCSLSIA